MITGIILDICNMSVTWMCMVEGEDNPELIEKILVMHGKQQQKQQEDLDDAAVYRICGDIRMKFQEEQ
jgi:hypothetical protein